MVSMLGYVLLARIKWNISLKYSFIFVFSIVGCIVYFGGLLNILFETALSVFLLGIILFFIFSIRKKLSAAFNLKELSILNIAFIILFAYIFSSLVNTRFIHYDNFSHWGVVVKDMLIHNAFPTASSDMIDFKNYSLGSSSFLYLVCLIVGHNEGVMLIGQSLLIFGCFYAMFGVVRDTKRMLLTSLLALCFAVLTYFNISIRINNLLVDFLLPIFALAAIAAIYGCRDNIPKAAVISTPILALLVIIKTSAVFFAAICYLYLIFMAFNSKKFNPSAKKGLHIFVCVIFIALSLVTLIAWNVHTSFEFKDETAKFEVSSDNLSTVYSEKTTDEINTILNNFLTAVLSLESLASLGIVLFNALALISYLIARIAFKKKWKLFKVLFFLDIAVIIYYVGILAMFLYSMPTDEALRLAGFERYASSIVIFFIGALSLCAVNDTEKSFHIQQGDRRNFMAFKSLHSKSLYQNATVLFVSITVILLLSEVNGMNYMKQSYPDTVPAKVESVVGDNWSEIDNHKYLFYATDNDRQISDYYLQYVGRYLLYAPHVDAISAIDAGTLEDRIDAYDYLVIIESDEAVRDFMYKTAGIEANPGVYSTEIFNP